MKVQSFKTRISTLPQCPPGVKLWDEFEVLPDPLEILPRLPQLGVGIAVEGESDDLRVKDRFVHLFF